MNQIYRTDQAGIAPLAAGSSFVSGWFTAGSGSGQSVRASAYVDQPGSLFLQQTDDPGLPNQIFEIGRVSVTAGNAAKVEAGVTGNFWRFIFSNPGSTAQTVFQVVAYSANDLNGSILTELRRINLQLLAMRGKDNPKDDFSQI